MTDTKNTPVTLDEVQWSENFVVSMNVTDAPEIALPCGHGVKPMALVLVFSRGSLEGYTPALELQEWKIYGTHDHGGAESEDVTLSSMDFGDGRADLPGFLEEIGSVLESLMPGLELPRPERLGDVPEWVTTAIKSYRPQVERYIPVRLDATYHG